MQTKHMIWAVIGVALVAFLLTREAPVTQKLVRSEVTTVMYNGLFVANEANEYFILYESQPEPTVVPVRFDALSACVATIQEERRGAPCLAVPAELDAAFVGKPVTVEGSLEGDAVLVRKLMAIENEELPRTPSTGSVFIAWDSAVELVQRCEVRGITQTHALDVYLELPDGSTVRAVEPAIDAVFAVQAATSCLQFPVGTE